MRNVFCPYLRHWQSDWFSRVRAAHPPQGWTRHADFLSLQLIAQPPASGRQCAVQERRSAGLYYLSYNPATCWGEERIQSGLMSSFPLTGVVALTPQGGRPVPSDSKLVTGCSMALPKAHEPSLSALKGATGENFDRRCTAVHSAETLGVEPEARSFQGRAGR